MSTTHTATLTADERTVWINAFDGACRRIKATTTGMLTSDQLDACERHADRAVNNHRQQVAAQLELDVEIDAL